MALACNPKNVEAQKLLWRLDDDARKQRRKDKVAFKGLFDRGVIYDDTPNGATTANAKSNDERDIILGRQLAQLYEERGMHKEKEQIEQSLKQYKHEAEIMVSTNDHVVNVCMDFRNPTKSMIADAKSMGVDLTDPTTIALIEKLKDADERIDQECVRNYSASNRSLSGKERLMTTRPRMRLWKFLLNIVLVVVSIVWVLFAYINNKQS